MSNSVTRERVLVIGGGVAGLATALRLAPMPVTLLVYAPLGTEASTPWAQGGIAAALGADDAPALHAADTLTAGAGLTDLSVATRVATAAADCIAHLAELGAPFDRDDAGSLALGLEAAHSRRRIVHAGGDGTGRAVMEALIRAVRASPHIELLEGARATELVVEDGAVVAVKAVRNDVPMFLPARAVVLATGGTGALYSYTTNPLGSTGSGLALAARAGAVLRDMEFVQFHPSAIALGRDPMPLASEALRGEGAILVNERGERFMTDIPGAELAPRDVVARAVWREIARGGQALLDTREALGVSIEKRFPSVTALCREAGLDPVTQAIPVRPAAHYHMGGVLVDSRGRSSVNGLWACGEVASTGLHGANRLASNSLLEALAYARWIAADISGVAAGRPARPVVLAANVALNAAEARRDAAQLADIRTLMTQTTGLMRDADSLHDAIAKLEPMAFVVSAASNGVHHTRASDAALVGLLIAIAARERHESRGAHCRRDYPAALPEPASHTLMTLAEARTLVAAAKNTSSSMRNR